MRIRRFDPFFSLFKERRRTPEVALFQPKSRRSPGVASRFIEVRGSPRFAFSLMLSRE